MVEENTNSDGSLKEEVKKTNKLLQDILSSDKAKKVKAKKLSKREQKKNYVRYIFIDENKNIQAMKVPVEEGTTGVNGVPRVATTEYMMTWEGQPAIIQPAWSTFPFDPAQDRDRATQERRTVEGNRLLLNAIELGKLKAKKKLSGIVIILIIVAIVVVGYFAIKGFS